MTFSRRVITALLAAGLSLPATLSTAQDTNKTVAIVQIVEHPDLNNVREGALAALAEAGFDDIEVVYESAQGDMATGVQIANRFASMEPDLIIPIGTPVAQAMVRTTNTIPIVFGGIGDPLGAGIVPSLEKPGGNVTGTASFTPVGPQLDLIQEMLPEAKTIGILNNPAEANSEASVNAFLIEAEKRGLDTKRELVTSSAETLNAASNLVGRVDAIYIPTDSTVVSSAEAVVRVALENKIPLFTAETGGVNRGALASTGFDWRGIGMETGRTAARVLNGEKPGDIDVTSATSVSTRLNQTTADAIGVTFGDAIKAQAVEIVGQ